MPDPGAMPPPPLSPPSATAPDARPVMRETARDVALAADREMRTRGPLADAAGVLDAPSAELVRLLDHLRRTVGRHVRERRAAGLPIERVLPEVKGLVREATALEGWFDSADTLMAHVVRWIILAYYDQPELVHVPRCD